MTTEEVKPQITFPREKLPERPSQATLNDHIEIAQREANDRLLAKIEKLEGELGNAKASLRRIGLERDQLQEQLNSLVEGDITKIIDDLFSSLYAQLRRETRLDGPTIIAKLRIMLDNWKRMHTSTKEPLDS